MRNRFDEQLSLLHEQLIEMGAQCEELIVLSVRALTLHDRALAKTVAPLGAQVDRMERSIESLCLNLLLRQQPVAGDLRQVSAALKMITDMERIGDQAEDIAEIVSLLGDRSPQDLSLLPEMARAVSAMVTESVDAYVQGDLALARKVVSDDDAVDDLFLQVRQRLTQLIADNPAEGAAALDLLMIAKYFERIGDHAVNIAQWVAFSVTGVHEE